LYDEEAGQELERFDEAPTASEATGSAATPTSRSQKFQEDKGVDRCDSPDGSRPPDSSL